MKIGWIGLGSIGLPMATRLHQAGHTLWVWDIDPGARARAADLGMAQAAPPCDLIGRVDAVCICLSSPTAIDAVVFGENGLSAAGHRQALIIDHSTIDPEDCRAIAQRARAEIGLSWVDCPISGGVAAAAQGTLIAWLGGDRDDVELARGIVRHYVRKATHMGAIGQGQLAKSCNQLIVAATLAAWSEMTRYAQSFGLDLETLVGSLAGGATDSRIADAFAEQMKRGPHALATTPLFMKDLAVVIHQAERAGTPCDLARAARAEFADFLG